MKKISRRSFLKVAGIGAAALGLAACGGSSASTTTSTASSTAASAGGSDADFTNTTLTLYSPGGENSVPTKTIIKYGELIEEATGGAVKCDVQYGGTLGNDAEAIESTRMGTIDLIFAGTSGFYFLLRQSQGHGSALPVHQRRGSQRGAEQHRHRRADLCRLR